VSATSLTHACSHIQRRQSAAIGAWLEPLRHWPNTVIRSLQTSDAVVRVVIASVRGSSPREAGTCMLVERERVLGTIGGGQLEWSAIATARGLLTQSSHVAQVHKLTLGPQLSQCCGGAVELWFERYLAEDVALLRVAADAATRGPTVLVTSLAAGSVQRRIELRAGTPFEFVREHNAAMLRERLDEVQPQVWLYGAGHVGQALARVLITLPLQLTWIDSRRELLPADISERVHTLLANDPVSTVAEAPVGTRFLVMTHSHPLDYALSKAVLERNDRPWIGVIGSKSKSVRFRSRLLREGLSHEQADRLVCPIGIDGIDSKLPAAIAVAVAAQLLQMLAAPARSRSQGHDCDHHGCKRCALTPGASS
jgi:xanthine dehydrogenase accessory factor